MHTFVKAACAVHTLSLAKALGGPLFAKSGLRPALINQVSDEKERGRIMAAAWNKYNRVNIPAHILFTATWAIEKSAIRALHTDQRTKELVRVKDILVKGAFIAGIANVIAGKMIQRDFPDGVPVNDKETTDPKLQAYRRYYRVMGPLHVTLLAGSLAIGPFLVGAIIRSQKKNVLRRVLGV